MEVTIWKAIFLGIIQGLTEFLPVSSSGHLVIMQHFLGIQEAVLTFDVMLHMGTLVAVFVAFWGDILEIIKKPLERLTFLIIVGTIPAGLMGFLLEDFFTGLFSSLRSVGFALLVTGFLLWISDRFQGTKTTREMSYIDALVIGIFQGIAITPGISRSGSTIVGALWRGLDRVQAAKFSFLLSIPVILGAGLKELVDAYQTSGNFVLEQNYLIGTVVAAGAGFLAIKILLSLVQKGKLRYFAFYCWILAAFVIASSLVV